MLSAQRTEITLPSFTMENSGESKKEMKGRMKMELNDVMDLQGTEIIADGVELPASTASDGC
ncbi:hypothetical protein GCM10009799_46680 [Nocardiopsis rhodophaea]|uniref:Uncharacterized protein n=1 Tax=Nocardiopsis rhodophaea TaxID=280238 RepID=A0ABP5F4X8_9ACTN